jgi:zinc protease
MVFKPTFPIDEFEKEKGVIRREIDMGMDDPDDHNGRLLYSTALANDPRKQPVIGHMELFNQLTHEDMVTYHRQRYTTENTFLSISGDFDKQELLKFLEEITASIPLTFTHPAPLSPEPSQLGKRVQRKTFAIPTSKLTLAWQVPSLEHPDAASLDLLSTILGSGRSSRLYQNIREKSDLCHHIGAWSMIPPTLPGLFAVSALVDHDKRDDLQKAILDEIEKLITADMDQEIHKATRMTLASQFGSLSTASGRASDLASNWHEARNLDFTRDYVEQLTHITTADLQRVARTYLVTDKLTITSLDPEDSTESHRSTSAATGREKMQTRTLDNGLTLIMQRDPRLPTVSITVATLTGLPSETPENSGINTLLACLMPKGTQTRSAEEIALTMDSMGARFGVSCGNNTTLTSGSCLSPDLEQTLTIIADIIQTPTLPEDSLERERKAMISAIRENAEDPISVAFQKLRPSLFGQHGYGLNSLGTEESLGCLNREQLIAHHQQYFTATNSVISIFGDLDLDATAAMVQQQFAHMPRGEQSETPTQDHLTPANHDLHLDKQQAVITVGFTGVGASNPDTYALELINDYCCDMAGPLFSKIREELGLAYYVSATQFHGVNTGMFAFYLGTSPDQLDLAKKHLLEEIQTIAEHGIPDDKLESVKTTWLASHALANQKIGSLARLSAIDSLLGFEPDHHLNAPDHIRALTGNDIRKAAKKYLGSSEPVIVTVTPEA